jgi:hypothetical protein
LAEEIGKALLGQKPGSAFLFKGSIADGPVKSLLGRHPGELRIGSGAGAGVQMLK